jgi:hypothetical protein
MPLRHIRCARQILKIIEDIANPYLEKICRNICSEFPNQTLAYYNNSSSAFGRQLLVSSVPQLQQDLRLCALHSLHISKNKIFFYLYRKNIRLTLQEFQLVSFVLEFIWRNPPNV